MKRNLLQFLFGESQVDEEFSALVESIAEVDTDGVIGMKVEKAPLEKALKSLGIEGDALESDPRGLSLVFSDGDSYRAAHAILNEPDSLAKLAGMGWVYSLQGDVAQIYEPGEWRIRFLEIDNVEPSKEEPQPTKGTAQNTKIQAVIKAGREFATKKPEHWEHNPVEFDDKTSDDNQKGMSKAKDGEQPEGKPKGSTKESIEDDWYDKEAKSGRPGFVRGGKAVWLKKWKPKKAATAKAPGSQPQQGAQPEGTPKGVGEALEEGRHKPGCQCGFCKNMGSFGKKKDKAEELKKGAEPEKSEGKAEDVEHTFDSLQTPQEIVDKLLQDTQEPRYRNPGTPPAIMGHKSFKTMKLPKGYPDQKFKPAKGMVQPDSGIVNQQTKRKVGSK